MFSKKNLFIAIGILLLIISLVAFQNEPENKLELEPDEKNAVEQESYNLLTTIDQFLNIDQQLLIKPNEVFQRVVLQPDPNYFVVDLRQRDHFVTGSIIGAVNIPYGTTWQPNQIDKLPKDKKIVLVCYSGHTASQTAAFWSMLGYDVVVMEHGMRGWLRNPDIIGVSALACEPAENPVTVNPLVIEQYFDLPPVEFETGNLKELLIAQSYEVINNGAGPVVSVGILAEQIKEGTASDNYFLLDIRDSGHYESGHINGAINVPYRNLAQKESLQKLPNDQQIVIIGYDGHDASKAARALGLLGYNTRAMLNGMSAWTNDESVIGAEPISCALVADYPTVITRVDVADAGAG